MGFKLTKDFLENVNDAIEHGNLEWFEQNVFILHDVDVAAIIDELDEEEAAYLYGLLNENAQADVLTELDEDTREDIISSFSSKEIAEQLENLDSDDATDIISELPQDQIEEVISHIKDDEAAEDIVDLLNYAEDTAGGLMQKEFIHAKVDWPVNRCVIELRRQAEGVEKVYTIYVVDDANKLVGFLSLKRLLFASPQTKIG
ncbi:MAG: magnesium transporter, partial [Crocinitomicaceae bacterium]|nr:magnesium transporter [Crocinitomicaceae bacterium]